ncbi:MAG TPA: hypothetical protein VFO36_04585, partial [Nitrospiraceae bacterium]|nr:hypothetical protein [Nitrospiraceae bacterium]
MQRSLARKQSWINALTYVGTRFSQQIDQTPRTRLFVRLQRGDVISGCRLTSMEPHEEIDVQL